MKNVFVTGAAGFIGKHVMNAFSGRDYKFYLLARPEDKLPAFTGMNIEWVIGDINDTGSYLNELSNCSILIHMAAELYNPEKFELVNIKGVQSLIDAVKKCCIDQVIHLSSIGVTGMQFSDRPVTVDEQTPCDPKNGYEKSKLVSEQLWLSNLPKTRLTILRPTNVYGDLHPGNHLLNLFNFVKNHQRFYLAPSAVVNYVYVGDVANIIRFFVENPGISGIYNIGNSILLKDFIETISGIVNSKINIKTLPSWLFRAALLFKFILPESYALKILSLHNAVIYADEKLRTMYLPEYGYEYGLRKTFDYFVSKKLING
jgi:nucleoside-diphosphate-sugar epimerase